MTLFLVVAGCMAVLAAVAVAAPLLRERQSRIVGAVAAVLVVGSAAGLYPLWSNWDWHAPVAGQGAGPDVLAMVSKLEGHLREDPKDLKGWLMLGRSDLALDRPDKAVLAYGRARDLDPTDVDAVLGLGEATSLLAGGNLTPAAVDYFEQGLKLAPDNPKALLYGGFAAAARGDNAAARSRWQALKDLHPPAQIVKILDEKMAALDAPGAGGDAASGESDSGDAIAGRGMAGSAGPTGGMARADAAVGGDAARGGAAGGGAASSGAGVGGPQENAVAGSAGPSASGMNGAAPGEGSPVGGTSAQGAAGATVTVDLSIAPGLKARLTREAPLFVFARELGGRGPPLAAKRLTSVALGTEIKLTAADSMIPGRVLVSGRQVSITARVSFSGQPLPAAGDLYGELTYDVGHDGARSLVIDRVAE